jgi:hypothetical protein
MDNDSSLRNEIDIDESYRSDHNPLNTLYN